MKCSVITGDVFRLHDSTMHAESGERLDIVLKGVPDGIRVLDPVRADIADIERVHRPQHVRLLRELSRGPRYLDANTYVTAQSFDVALYAAGSAGLAVERALDGEHCFALVRPPGHHAEPDRSMGFCLFNNIAVAVARALEKDLAERVVVIDWDLHHGNGTQKIFYSDDRVLFCSIHQCGAFPRTGWIDEIGISRGKGCTVNAPLRGGAAIPDYALIFQEVFSPVISRYDPDLVVISAGQDTLADDPRGNMDLTPPDFGLLTQMMMEITDLPVALVLEGGYGPSHGDAIGHIFRALLKKERYHADTDLARPSTNHLLHTLKKVHL